MIRAFIVSGAVAPRVAALCAHVWAACGKPAGVALACMALLLVGSVTTVAAVTVAPVDSAVVLGVAAVPAQPVPGAKVRTPARIEVLAGQEAAGSAGSLVEVGDPVLAAELIAQGKLTGWLGVVPEDDVPAAARAQVVELGYSVAPMAILRTDTDIRSWRALAGRTVCLAADGRHVGQVASRYGAIEKIYPSLTDALLGLRTGACDALVHDQAFLEALLKFPEWHKFSARLMPARRVVLARLEGAGSGVAVASAGENALLRASSARHLAELTAGQARDIAFEVYLDQTVPDCH